MFSCCRTTVSRVFDPSSDYKKEKEAVEKKHDKGRTSLVDNLEFQDPNHSKIERNSEKIVELTYQDSYNSTVSGKFNLTELERVGIFVFPELVNRAEQEVFKLENIEDMTSLTYTQTLMPPHVATKEKDKLTVAQEVFTGRQCDTSKLMFNIVVIEDGAVARKIIPRTLDTVFSNLEKEKEIIMPKGFESYNDIKSLFHTADLVIMDFNLSFMTTGLNKKGETLNGDDITASIISDPYFNGHHPIIIKNSDDGFVSKDRFVYDASLSKSKELSEWERILKAFIIA